MYKNTPIIVTDFTCGAYLGPAFIMEFQRRACAQDTVSAELKRMI